MGATDMSVNRTFTDCVSFAIVRELRIRDAFTADHHFKQAAFAPVLKPLRTLPTFHP
jgi:predicted nucleic acid-binding protein